MNISFPAVLTGAWLLCLALTAPAIPTAPAPTQTPAVHRTAITTHKTKTTTVKARRKVAGAAATTSTSASRIAKTGSAQTSATLAKKAVPAKEWWYHPHKDHTPSGAPEDVNITKYHACYLGDTSRKVVYLTIDEGSEFGYTVRILDTLKAAGVHATFFVTRYYMKSAPELVKRMIAEGHTIGNHSATHPENLGAKTDQRIKDEILQTAQYYKGLTGQEMPMLFRPPCGVCDDRTLTITTELGWRPVFWSMAYQDYIPEKQKGAQYATDYVKRYYHPGAIIILHPFASNTAAMGTIIKELKDAGYEFGSLVEMQGKAATKVAAK